MQFKPSCALIGGSIQRQPEQFLRWPHQPDRDRFCRRRALPSAFSGSQSVALPSGTSASDVQMVYQVARSNENCVANY
jgi:hypothetical protein